MLLFFPTVFNTNDTSAQTVSVNVNTDKKETSKAEKNNHSEKREEKPNRGEEKNRNRYRNKRPNGARHNRNEENKDITKDPTPSPQNE